MCRMRPGSAILRPGDDSRPCCRRLATTLLVRFDRRTVLACRCIQTAQGARLTMVRCFIVVLYSGTLIANCGPATESCRSRVRKIAKFLSQANACDHQACDSKDANAIARDCMDLDQALRLT
jgi:hypothetical protein